METISELKEHLLSYGFNCDLGFEYKQIKPDSPNWCWHLTVTRNNQKKVFQLYKYSGKRSKLIKDFVDFAGNQKIKF